MAVQKNRAALECRSSHLSAGLKAPRPSGRLRAWHGHFATATALAAVMALPRCGLAGPTGGTVVGGTATISSSGTTTNINQSTNSAIINWQTFSIAPSETVNFYQPGSTSVTLNRVIGNEQSIIAGALNANGRVFIVNAAGIVFTNGAQVNVGGLVASTLDISNQDFMAGNYTFAGSSSASVVNQGRIHASSGGYVALLGKTVSNDGVIVANLGTVAMASGEKITLNFSGNSLVDVTIDKGTLNALVENKRAIIANGGRVILTAKAADQILSAQVNNSGIIQARTMASLKGGGSSKGSVKLLAQGGTVTVTGKIDASAPKGGDGGFVETSGDKVRIADSAVITTKSTYGKNGSWLIDPDGFTIAAVGGDISGKLLSAELALTDVTIASTSGHGSDGNINVNDTVTWSAGTTLTLNATSAINVNSLISGPNGGLVLNAGTNININAPSSLQVATLNATAQTGDVNFNAPQTFSGAGTWTFSGHNINVNDAVNWSAGTLTLNAGAAGGFINLNAVMTASGTANLVLTYNTGMDTSTIVLNGFTLPSATYGTPLGGINPLVDPNTGTFIGSIQFTNTAYINSLPTTNLTTSPLVINGQPYVLITSIGNPANPHDLSIINNSSGNYALAGSLDAGGRLDSNGNIVSGSTVYTDAPITAFYGTLEGLGNAVSNLVIVQNPVDPNASSLVFAGQLGLIGTIGSTATVRDIGVENVYIRSSQGNFGGTEIGGLAGTNNGIIINAYVTGNPNAGVPSASAFDGVSFPRVTAAIAGAADVGGLVGGNTGIIYNSHSTASVWGIGSVGGLVGSNSFTGTAFLAPVILNSYSAGTVSAGIASTGSTLILQGGGVGGFIGVNGGGVISNSYTTSTVWTENVPYVGGFAGENNFARRESVLNHVSSSGEVHYFMTSDSGFGAVGGLVGLNRGQINASFTSSNLVLNITDSSGFGAIIPAGALVGRQERNTLTRTFGATDGSTATGTITCIACNSSSPPAALIGTTVGTGTTTNSAWNEGAGGTPPTQSSAQAAAQAAAQQAANARNQAQALALQAASQQAAAGRAQAGGNAATVAATGTLRAATANPPSSAMSAAGTAAATVPSTLAINANLRAIETGVQADDQRIRRRVIAAAVAAPRRSGSGGDLTIRNLEINGKRINAPENNAPRGAPGQNPR